MHTRREQLAELLGSLSLATEAAVGFPPETTIRAAVVSVALARARALSDEDCASAYLASLLRYIGCSGFASETAWYAAAMTSRCLATSRQSTPPNRSPPWPQSSARWGIVKDSPRGRTASPACCRTRRCRRPSRRHTVRRPSP